MAEGAAFATPPPGAGRQSSLLAGRSSSRNLTLRATLGLRFVNKPDDTARRRPVVPLRFLIAIADWPVLYGRYRPVADLGTGTFSRVLTCLDLYTNRHVAVKVLNANCALVGQQEYEHLAILHRSDLHATRTIVQQYDAFVQDGHVCIVLEHLGPSLRADGAICLPPLRKMAYQVVLALGLMNRCDLIHADLKPENVLRAGNAQSAHVKLIDLGNSLRPCETSAYFDNFQLQSLYYRAPEVVLGRCDFSFPIDMWSLGCVLVELCTGAALFPAADPPQLLEMMEAMLGPIPTTLFRHALLFPLYERSLSNAPVEDPAARFTRIAERLETRDQDLVMFIGALLDYNPMTRLTPRQAFAHPFLAALAPNAQLFS